VEDALEAHYDEFPEESKELLISITELLIEQEWVNLKLDYLAKKGLSLPSPWRKD
jgi:hypothetical protein